VPEFQFNNNGFWTHYYPANTPFLSWQYRGRLAAYSEQMYLAWLQHGSVPNGPVLKVLYTVTYVDLALPPATLLFPFDSKPWARALPAGRRRYGWPASPDTG
jgi:hypothetical protein